MKKYKNQKVKLLLLLTILSVLGIGIGYSILTEKLDVGSSVAINEMKWDIGFSSVEDNAGSILSESEISSDGKSITVLCDFGTNTKQQTCTTKATITNNSTFDIGLKKDPTIIYDDTYIHTLTFKWNNHPTYENKTVLKDNFIAQGESEEVILTIKTKFMNNDNIPSQDTIIPVTITLDFIEWQQDTLPTKNDLAVLQSTTGWNDQTAFRSDTYRDYIKTITFEDKINIPSDAIESWDVGVSQNGNVMAYIVHNETDSTYYDLYIQSNTQLYANKNMYWWFNIFRNIEAINNLNLLNTSDVTDMSYMFSYSGYNSSKLTLDVSTFDTSSVTNMDNMFCNLGFKSLNLTLDVSNFDTSNVTNMNSIFFQTGQNATEFTLDVSNFDTRKVTNMYGMFAYSGYNSPTFTLDVSNFDTSNVTTMSNMFWNSGARSPTFTLDVSNFDTRKVTDLSGMFARVGFSNSNFTLDVSNFDTRNVTNMQNMFDSAGYNSIVFTLDVSNFDTSKVTDMSGMFAHAGNYSKTFTLDVSNFDTSNVTTMSNMFWNSGANNTSYSLDTSNFDTSKVIDMSGMFASAGYNSTKLNTSITIKNLNTTEYTNMFNGTATKAGAQITVNYTSETSDLADAMIATKSENSNVVKGVQVD